MTRSRRRNVAGSTLLALGAAALCMLAVDSARIEGQSPAASRPGEIIGKPAAPPPSTPKSGDPTKGTSTIRGRILLPNGRPARKASIQLVSNGPAKATAADENGNYEFTELPADTYHLTAGRPGYIVLEYGQKRAFEPGDAIELGEGENRSKVDITLVQSGAVSGRVVDENGEPLEGVTVRLLQAQYFSNRRQLVDVAQAGGRATDDTGAFRIYGVPPGDYIVRASVNDPLPTVTTAFGNPSDQSAADIPGYAPTYYPGTINPAEAQMVRVGLSEDAQGIDISLIATPTARLSGFATDSRNQPATVFLARSQRSGGFSERIGRSTPGADGSFTFDKLAPGDYVVQTTGPRRDQSVESDFAMMYVTMNGRNVPDVRLQGTSGSTLSGNVTFEGLGSGARPPAIQITAWPADFERSPMNPTDIARSRVRDDGFFSLGGLQGPRRIQLAQAFSSWQIKSVRVNGADVTDEALAFGLARDSLSGVQVVVTNQGPKLIGTATDELGRAAHDFSVVAFAVNADRWYPHSRFMAAGRARPDGTFQFPALAPGDYYVVAVNTLMNAEGWGEWQDPEFLRKLSASATRVTLDDGQTASVVLRVMAR